jgi:hypothetical protein
MRGWKAAPAAAGATALLLLIQSAHALYSSNSPVKQLDESNFKEQVLKDDGVWMVRVDRRAFHWSMHASFFNPSGALAWMLFVTPRWNSMPLGAATARR